MARDRLSDDAWEQIADVFGEPAKTGRPRKDPRDVVDGILYVLRTGCAWRDLAEEFGPWQSLCRHFNQWERDGTLDEILHRLVAAHVDAREIDEELWCEALWRTSGRTFGPRAARRAAVKKGARGAWRSCIRPLSRRLAGETPRRLRPPGTPARRAAFAGANPRVARTRSALGGRRLGRPSGRAAGISGTTRGRQSVSRRLDRRLARRTQHQSSDPLQIGPRSRGATRPVRPRGIPRAEHRRATHRLAKGKPPRPHAVRENRRQLPRHGQMGLRQTLPTPHGLLTFSDRA